MRFLDLLYICKNILIFQLLLSIQDSQEKKNKNNKIILN